MPNDVSLGAALATMMEDLSDTIDRTPDKARRDQLLAAQGEIHARLQTLVDKTVKQNIAEYQQATAAVTQSITALKATQQDIARVAKAIETLAQVVSALTKLAGALA